MLPIKRGDTPKGDRCWGDDVQHMGLCGRLAALRARCCGPRGCVCMDGCQAGCVPCWQRQPLPVLWGGVAWQQSGKAQLCALRASASSCWLAAGIAGGWRLAGGSCSWRSGWSHPQAAEPVLLLWLPPLLRPQTASCLLLLCSRTVGSGHAETCLPAKLLTAERGRCVRRCPSRATQTHAAARLPSVHCMRLCVCGVW
jgi:hypothetical protein